MNQMFLLYAVACVALLITIFYQMRHDWRAGKIKRWVRKNHPDVWTTLPFLHRHLLKVSFAICALRKTQSVDDPVFIAAVVHLRKDEIKSWVWLSVAAVLFGTILTAIYLN
jgi:hypothetical protein